MIEAGRSRLHSADRRVSGDISMWTIIVHCAIMCLAGPHARLIVSHTKLAPALIQKARYGENE